MEDHSDHHEEIQIRRIKEVFIPLNILIFYIYGRFYSLGTTTLVTWNFTNFTIFIFLFFYTYCDSMY
jgi:hypothetical protein